VAKRAPLTPALAPGTLTNLTSLTGEKYLAAAWPGKGTVDVAQFSRRDERGRAAAPKIDDTEWACGRSCNKCRTVCGNRTDVPRHVVVSRDQRGSDCCTGINPPCAPEGAALSFRVLHKGNWP